MEYRVVMLLPALLGSRSIPYDPFARKVDRIETLRAIENSIFAH